MTEEEMRQALFGSVESTVRLAAPQAQPNGVNNQSAKAASKRKMAKNFVPKLVVTLRVGSEYEGTTALITHEADTLSHLQAEVDAMKIARKKYRYVELVSVKPAR
ncbi:hypothetical protein A247_14137 [Pseudomonas syringae pv. actinidiae ICMP 19099]|uniref:Uncharacterized protein n=2 Tax=Pseudomonas syringae TaxID=317 RepID=A0A656JVQ2_PSESF|nr:hypothetical protein [Pseudomonas syringae]EPN56987.1 hypothetical protein A245_21276 [Pseudomonas syringae pv. actinidiae ICMP 19096]EPM46180.1 hypothetical protein A246_17277 [Pseudomonas syringae pv. actinidiae ICMP 19098]EPN13379.1 hypothetical protein A248_28621 [Pseudomonas syringae pv. actinidiae ICMP 19100]EPN25910.1 hypothetical protein A247_14137 [Pseudomonas syringae pv. actinidiae ICMP 19099]EPN33985.1 hypothetical protein A243_14421 [Pseudomonas syringae pv. actinidiae ICMP 188